MRDLLITFAVGTLLGLLAAGIPALLFFRLREKSFADQKGTYEHSISTLSQQLGSALDRLYGYKNLPPGEVNMKEIFEEKRQEEQERRIERNNGGALRPRRIGAVDQVQLDMEQGVASGQYRRDAQ